MGMKCQRLHFLSLGMRAGGQPSPSPSHLHTVSLLSVLIIAELARGRRWSRNLDPNFCHWTTTNFTPYLIGLQLRFLSCAQDITRCYHLANSIQILRLLPPTEQRPKKTPSQTSQLRSPFQQ